MDDLLDDMMIPSNKNGVLSNVKTNSTDGEIVWSFGGGAVKWIALAEGAKVSIKRNGFPTIVVGVSAGALLAPVITEVENTNIANTTIG